MLQGAPTESGWLGSTWLTFAALEEAGDRPPGARNSSRGFERTISDTEKARGTKRGIETERLGGGTQ